MTVSQLKPRAVFHYNGVPLIVRRVEKLPDGNCRVHVRLDGHSGSVTLPAARRCAGVADPVKFRRPRRRSKPAKTGD
jgi:hypothetical protein